MKERLSMLNVVEKLVVAAYRLDENGISPFSAEDLVVSAWENFPDTFGLRGYRDKSGKLKHPDSNRVFAEIMGTKPIRQRGYLTKIGTKKYQLTESGKELARFLLHRANKTSIEKAGLPRDIETQLKALLESRAIKKLMSGRESELTFFDACDFWKISPRSTSIELEGKHNNFETIINYVKDVIKDKKVTFQHGGRDFTSIELNKLMEVHRILLTKFKKEMDIINERKDERL